VSRGKCFTWNNKKENARSKKQKVKRGNGGSVRGVTRKKRKEIRKQ